MAKEVKKPLQSNFITRREFNYSKGEVTLNFILALDKQKLTDFCECLNEAIKDVSNAVKEIK